MLFTNVFVAASAFAIASAAKIGNTAAQFNDVKVGQTFNITWYDASGPVALLLKNGEANVLKTYASIASGLTGTSYAWTIPTTLPVDFYAFEADDASGVNYSIRFQITGGPALSSSSSASRSTTASTASSTSGSSASTTSGSTSTTSGSSSTTVTSSSQSSTGTSSRTSTSATTTATTGAVNSASGVSSPLALVLLAFAAIITLN